MISLPGINTNVRHKNQLYHIQTEVNTVNSKKIVSTLIYLKGSIRHSFKSEVSDEATHDKAVFRSRIELCHRKAIKKLVSGDLGISDKESETGGENKSGEKTDNPLKFAKFLKKMYLENPLLHSNRFEHSNKTASFRKLLTEKHSE